MQRSCADMNSPHKQKCWTNSGGPLINSQYSEVSPLLFWGKHNRLRERGWGVPILTRGQTLWYSRYILCATGLHYIAINKYVHTKFLSVLEIKFFSFFYWMFVCSCLQVQWNKNSILLSLLLDPPVPQVIYKAIIAITLSPFLVFLLNTCLTVVRGFTNIS